jgi:hypothetical protein
MYSFTCARCGILVVMVNGERHPENIYCLECRFIESIEDAEVKAVAAKILDRVRQPEGEES